MCLDDEAGIEDSPGRVACELAETLEGMSLYAQRLASAPECPHGMASELQLIRVALLVCIARADALAKLIDNRSLGGTAG